MRKIFLAAIIMVIIPAAYGAGRDDIIAGPEIESCFNSNADRGKASECLHALSDKSNKNLDELITNTVKQIKENNTGPVYNNANPELTIGDVFSKFFIQSQDSWKQYRKNLCLGVGSQIGEDTYDYWPYIYQCKINLNKRHPEEIKMLHTDQQ
ncbi:DUF1311 domain-containing protein [Enterobacter sp. Bisph1]|uniref:DUF1311 domain-containing protein n=1 Tax=Enterobacter sp. Bisph1 TaxID=1274399 RepID=UPI00068EA4E5|nr:DUF1311 domain-containing protein [Enterobacter sp. Bisph1]